MSTLPRVRAVSLLSGYWLPTYPSDVESAASVQPSYATAPISPAGRTTPSAPSSVQPLGLALAQPGSSPSGTLQLDVEPRSAQLYVDGFAAGGVEEINAKGGLRVAAGWHRLEFRARGYETPAVNVTVEPNQTMTYHLALRPNVP